MMTHAHGLDPRVLVLDGNSQASLSVARSLNERGVTIDVGSARRGSIGAHSRHVDASVAYPDPATEPEAFIDALVAHLTDTEYDAVIPTRDDTTTIVAQQQDRLAATGTTVGVEDWDRFRLVADKARTFEIAADLDVPTPVTRAPESLADVRAIADDLPYPVVVKSRSKNVQAEDDHLDRQIVGDDHYADSAEALVDTYRQLLAENNSFQQTPPLIQEYIPGKTTTTVGVADDGEFLTHFQERRLRTTPASGGSSTLIRGFRDERLLEHAAEVVDTLGWTGPIQVEFMWTPDDEFVLIEVNGRYWGSTPLAVASGVDIPAVHYALLTGATPHTPTGYRDDVVQQRLFYGDLKWLDEQLENGEVRALAPFVAALIRADQVFVDFTDPGPTLASIRQAAALAGEGIIDAARARIVGS
jgi:predicted ATP-grasp superfamily ATP-dependent carboligase